MRINRLDLTRYGKFTDAVFDFGPRPVGSPDLHVVYGPNEAGKSTTFNAILDLVFGIGHSTKYGFLHPYSAMRLGGNLHVGSREREFIRVKRLQNSLLDVDERSLADSEILADLGGIDRESFSTMFSLDEVTLQRGGESILASKGNLGELLFSASAGLSDLSRQLNDIRGDAEGFYKYRARNTKLGELKSRLADIKQQKETLDLQAGEFARRKSELVAQEELYKQALERQSEIQRRTSELNRVLQALPTMARLSSQRTQLKEMAVVSQHPASWKHDLSDIRRESIELRVKSDSVARSIAEIEDEVTNIADPDIVLAFAGQVDELIKTLEPRYVTAQVDIPKLKGRIAELSVEALLLQLGKPGEKHPARLVLDAATIGKFRGLINSRSGVEVLLDSATKELSRADRALEDEGENFERLAEYRKPQRRRAFEALAAAVKTLSKTDDETSLRPLERRRRAAEADLADCMAQLAPWQGTPAELAALPLPLPVVLDRWKVEFVETRDEMKAAKTDLERLQIELARTDAEVEAIRKRSGEIDEGSAIASRATRDNAWLAHRQSMSMDTALNFERALWSDDQLVVQRLLHFAETGKLAQLDLVRAAAAIDIRSANLRLTTATNVLSKIASEMRDGFATGTAERLASFDPSELHEWIRERAKAIEARTALESIDEEIAEVRDRVTSSREHLIAAMKTAGLRVADIDEPASLIAIAEIELDRFNTAMDQADRLERLNADRIERVRVLAEAEEKVAAWNHKWSELCQGCWFKDEKSQPDADAVNAIILVLEKLSSALESKEGLLDRIVKMEKDSVLFEETVLDLCGALDVRRSASFAEMTRAIGEKIKIADRDRDRIAKLEKTQEEARDQERKLTQSREILDGRIREMTAFFDCDTMDEVEIKIELFEERESAKAAVSDLERELVAITGNQDIGAVEQRLSVVDRDAVETELEGLKPILRDQDQICRDAFHELSTLRKSLDAIGGDAAVAEIEEQRRTLLLEIEERAGAYLELRLGVAAAEQALKLYRDRHRSGLMSKASEAFRTISRGAYTGVAAQPGKDGEVLVALSANGGSISAEGLSRGARFQLYLALRVAGYHEFVAERPAVPFIADDIMETFDDFRAEETFKLFAEMAQHGQVIYLTHHRHLTDIARKVCPSVRLHDFEKIHEIANLDGIAAE